jgi:hypothetical protein
MKLLPDGRVEVGRIRVNYKELLGMFREHFGRTKVTVWIVVRWEDFESDEVVGVYATKDAALLAHPAALWRDGPVLKGDARRHSGFSYYEQEVEQ